MTGASTGAPERARRSACGPLLGCAAPLLLLVGGTAALSVRAGRALDRRVADLGQRCAALRAAIPPERPALLGDPIEGNAVDEYHAVEWVLGPRPGWTTPPPNLPATDLPRDHPATAQTNPWGALGGFDAALDAGAPLPPPLAKLAATYGGLTRHVYDGLRRTRCDWDQALERGAAGSWPNMLALRMAANLLAVEAVLATDPAASARAGLAAVAFGRDVARPPTILSAMMGAALEVIGLRSIARTTRQRALPRATYEELLRVLDRLEPLDLGATLAGERMLTEVELARLAGRPLLAGAAPPDEPGLPTWLGPLFIEHEWQAYVSFFDELAATTQLPRGKAGPTIDRLTADLARSWTIVARTAIPNIAAMRRNLDETEALRGACRVLVAAHLHRLEHGAFPADLEALRPRLGGALPQDPFTGQPLRLARDGDALRCWSVGDDLRDDGGKAGPDVVLTTAVPPP